MIREQLIRKYISNIILVIILVTLLTWFWFGPCKNRVRIKESLEANNVAFNKNIKYEGFDYVELSSKETTKSLIITNNTEENIDILISFNSAYQNENNYISYTITDSEGNESSIRNLALAGYMLENKIASGETKEYQVKIWCNAKNLSGNFALILNSTLA